MPVHALGPYCSYPAVYDSLYLVGAGKFEHITPTLRDVLHWLPVRQRILYKVAATAFDCIRGTGSTYFRHVCTPIADVSGQAHLHSAERHDMLVPRTRTELRRRSFQVAAPTVWNTAGTPTLDTDQSQTVQRWAEVSFVHRSLLLILWEHTF